MTAQMMILRRAGSQRYPWWRREGGAHLDAAQCLRQAEKDVEEDGLGAGVKVRTTQSTNGAGASAP